MTITSVGYAGTITDDNWRRMATAAVGALYGVDDYASFRVAAGVGDRALTVGVGGGFGLGVRDVSDAPVTLTAPTVASGSRWDLVVLRRNWGTKVTTPTIITGAATKALPARNTGFETVNDQPLALARFQAGQSGVQEIVDLRCIPADAGVVAFDTLARSYLDRVGTQIRIGDFMWTRTIDATGSPTWVYVDVSPDTGWIDMTPATGWAQGYAQVRRVGPLLSLRISRNRPAGWSAGALLTGAMGARYRPDVPWPVGSSHSSGRTEFVVNTDGTVTASTSSGGATGVSLHTTYPAAKPTF